MEMNKKVFVIVVTHNGMQWYERCFNSLIDSSYPLSIIVVDNASTDGTVEVLKSYPLPQIHIIASQSNLGFAKANNIGIKYAMDHDADYVFLLNQDAWIEKDTVANLLTTFEDNERVGIASPIHINGQGIALDRAFDAYMPFEFHSDSYLGVLQRCYSVPFVNAAAWMLSTDCLKEVGGFDTILFVHYCEDNNLCQRVLYRKYKIIVNTSCRIYHDRENRAGWSKEGVKTFKIWSTELNMKLQYGDINKGFEKGKFYSSIMFILAKQLLLFRIGRVKGLIKLMENIKLSRAINIFGGEQWWSTMMKECDY